MDTVILLADAVLLWLGLGLGFGLAFVFFGMTRVDPAARGSGPGFRLLVLPGVAAIWPLFALRWAAALRGRPPPAPRRASGAQQRAQRLIWWLLAPAALALLWAALASRPADPLAPGTPASSPSSRGAPR